MTEIQHNIQNALTDVSNSIGSSLEAFARLLDGSSQKEAQNQPQGGSFKIEKGSDMQRGEQEADRISKPIGISRAASSEPHHHRRAPSGAPTRAASSRAPTRTASSASSRASDCSEASEKSSRRAMERKGPHQQFMEMVEQARAGGAYEAQKQRVKHWQEMNQVNKETKKDFDSKVMTVKKGYDLVCYKNTARGRTNLCDTEAFWAGH